MKDRDGSEWITFKATARSPGCPPSTSRSRTCGPRSSHTATNWVTITRPKALLESVDILSASDYALGHIEHLILRTKAELPPETLAFGRPAAMDIVHALFHRRGHGAQREGDVLRSQHSSEPVMIRVETVAPQRVYFLRSPGSPRRSLTLTSQPDHR